MDQFKAYEALMEQTTKQHCSIIAKGYTCRNSFQKNEPAVELDVCKLLPRNAFIFPILPVPLSNFMFDPKQVLGLTDLSVKTMHNIVQTMCKNAGLYSSPTTCPEAARGHCLSTGLLSHQSITTGA